MSKLSVWWLRLGINIERIKPGHPEQNGRHERMHLTLKTEATRPASENFLQQQVRFDEFCIHHLLTLIPYQDVAEAEVGLPGRDESDSYECYDLKALEGRRFVTETY